MIMFLIALLGYALGSISIKGLSLGTSGVLIVALIFGHFNLEVPSIIREIGLVSFVTAVGMMSGALTSTPALGTLMAMTRAEAVAVSYAVTYPVALIMVVLCCQFLPIFLS